MIRKALRVLLRTFGVLLVTLLLASGGTGLYFKLTDSDAWPERATVQTTGVFDKETSCFHGGGYDEWMADLREMNGHWNPLGWVIGLRFPRAQYEEAMATVDCRFVRYQNDGYEISGLMLAPNATDGKRLPVLIYNRGGNGSFGALTFAYGLWALAPYAQEGFLVLASSYRGSNESDPAKYGKDEFGGSEVRDVEKLIEFVDRLPQADPDNIFMLGASRGVMMNYLVARNTDRIRALASINGETDLEVELTFRPEMERVYKERIPDYATRRSEVLAQRSVMHWAEELPREMPILLIHGGKDWRVDPENGPRLKARLDAIGHPSKLVMYPEDDHSLRKNHDRAQDEVVAWFRANLRTADTTAAATASPEQSSL